MMVLLVLRIDMVACAWLAAYDKAAADESL
jgi:hypothetical protein